MNSRLNCKVGDLAIVVNTELPENLGQIVEVVGSQRLGRPCLKGRGHVWHVRSTSGRATLFYRYDDVGITKKFAEGPAPDRCLIPVSGLSLGDTVSEDIGVVKKPGRRRKALPTCDVLESANS